MKIVTMLSAAPSSYIGESLAGGVIDDVATIEVDFRTTPVATKNKEATAELKR